ncbi:MAG TPA: hypothetical protein VEK07_07290, partial [Polyangiaceae bacterium]|nr:hypothetical protein [Polyangiaceae bacterium]
MTLPSKAAGVSVEPPSAVGEAATPPPQPHMARDHAKTKNEELRMLSYYRGRWLPFLRRSTGGANLETPIRAPASR